MNLSKDLMAASSAPLILAILADGESYGYEIVQRVAELSGGKLHWTDGMMYPLLHRLEKQGYLAAVWRVAETGRKRKYYALTDAGKGVISEQQKQWQVVNNALNNAWRSTDNMIGTGGSNDGFQPA
ncbi:PadR family transcriptional regulator [Idiomarina tyrosinivorans]|uniref:PadR family transcriptional regulator n=1 Tax=Idiomarina tyrosinivorans TaxID=1445662 RepID=A0A432ZSN3_9GAMM|nr:helix-turn-helix transcriptional regulator [Idiomarina tyrosinivorans]RUO80935.1 PadR family transcriptional regulator [Idiomarina tyrosinivorans]